MDNLFPPAVAALPTAARAKDPNANTGNHQLIRETLAHAEIGTIRIPQVRV